jgi:alkylation response protein AidB-like acyl-CoA dehydrogenase
MGWDRLLVPLAWGGGGGSNRDACVLAEETARVLSAIPFVPVTLALAALCGDDAAGAQALLARYAGARPALLMESRRGAPDVAPATALGLGRGRWRLDGGDLVALEGAEAEVLVVLATCGEAVVLAAVDAAARGVRHTALTPADPTRPLVAVSLDRVVLDGEQVLGPFAPPAVTAALVDRAALLVAADSLGVAGAALEKAGTHARTRSQFGRPIGTYQAVQHALASAVVEIEHARSLVEHAAGAIDERAEDASLAASMAKLYATRTARNATATAIQAHGGLGFAWESGLHLYFKRAKANQALFGTSDWHADRIAALSGWTG